MMKRIKRSFALTTAVAVIVGVFARVNIFAATEINECDYNDGSARISVSQPKGYGSDDSIVDTGDEHIKALRVRKTTDSKGEPVDEVIDWKGLPALTSDYSTLSFDIKPMRGDLNASISLISKNSDGADARSIAVSFTAEGKITCGDAWSVVDASASTQIGSYSKGEWLSFTVTYDKSEQKMLIYLNDQNVREITNEKMSSFKDFVQLDKVRFYVTASMGLAGEELLWMDNVRWVNGVKKGVLGATISSFDEKNKMLTISFTEKPNLNSFKDKVILKRANVEGGEEEIPLTLESDNGLSLTFGYSKELTPNSEYVLILPNNITGINGSVLEDEYICYTTEQNAVAKTLQECNYDDGNTYIKTLIPDGYGEDDRIVETGEGHFKAMRVRKITNSGGTATDEVNSWSGLQIPDSDISAISFDINPRRSDLYASISFVGGSTTAQTEPVTISFYQNGQIVCGKSWTLVPGGTGTLIGTYQKDDWINFRVVHDKTAQTMSIYVNGDVKKVFTRDELAAFKFANIGFVRFFVSKSMGLAGEELFWLDNVKSEELATYVTVDSLRFNTLTGDINAPFSVVSRKIGSVDIGFSNDVNASTLTPNNVMLLYDGEAIDYTGIYDEAKRLFRIVPKRLPDTGANIEVKVCGAEDKNGSEIETYSSYITADNSEDKFEVAEIYFCDENGNKVEDIGSGNIYLNAVVINTTDTDKNIIISIMGYTDLSMSEYDYRSETLRAGDMLSIKNDINTLKIDTDAIECVRAFVQDADTGCVLTEGISLKKTDEKDGTIQFSDKNESLAKGEIVSIDVFAPGKELSDLTSASDFRDVLVYKTQTFADDNGSYNISFNINYPDAVSGMYMIKALAKDYLYSKSFLYVNPKKAENTFNNLLMPALNNGAKATGEVIFKNQFDLYIDDKYLDESIAGRAAELLIDYNKVSGLKPDNIKTVMNVCVAVAAFESGKIEDVFAEAEIFDLKNSALAKLFDKSFVDKKTSEDVAERLSATKYESVKKFYESLNDAFVLAVVENSVEPNGAKTVMNAFGIYGETSSHYAYVSGKHYDTISELKKALENYKPSGTFGNSGGSSGGSRGGANQTISVDTSETGANTSDSDENISGFTDLQGSEWASDAINYLSKKGIVNGWENGKFYPEDNITREEFTKMLICALNVDGEKMNPNFIDVDNNEWYAEYIFRAYCAGIVKGIDEKRFDIAENITRQDMAVMIYRAAKASGIIFDQINTETLFADNDDIADYAVESVCALKNAGIINGKGNDLFAPYAFATRAEAAKMIYGIIFK